MLGSSAALIQARGKQGVSSFADIIKRCAFLASQETKRGLRLVCSVLVPGGGMDAVGVALVMEVSGRLEARQSGASTDSSQVCSQAAQIAT